MGFSNMMSMLGSSAPQGTATPEAIAAHGNPGDPGPTPHDHPDMNFGQHFLDMMKNQSPVPMAGVPQQGMPQTDFISMNAKPPSGGGLSSILKLLTGI